MTYVPVLDDRPSLRLQSPTTSPRKVAAICQVAKTNTPLAHNLSCRRGSKTSRFGSINWRGPFCKWVIWAVYRIHYWYCVWSCHRYLLWSSYYCRITRWWNRFLRNTCTFWQGVSFPIILFVRRSDWTNSLLPLASLVTACQPYPPSATVKVSILIEQPHCMQQTLRQKYSTLNFLPSHDCRHMCEGVKSTGTLKSFRPIVI